MFKNINLVFKLIVFCILISSNLFVSAEIPETGKENVDTKEPIIDTTKPQIVDYAFETINNTNILGFGIFCNEAVKVTVTAEDGSISAGLDYIDLIYDYKDKDGNTLTLSPKVEIEEEKQTTYQAVFYLPANEALSASKDIMYDGILMAVAKDNAGNESIPTGPGDIDSNSSNNLMIENIKPEISVKIGANEADYTHEGQKWYKSLVAFNVSIEDRESGVNSVKIFMSKAGGEKDLCIEYEAESERIINKSFDVNTSSEDYGIYTLEVEVEDNAGNTNTSTDIVYIDKIAPTVDANLIQHNPNIEWTNDKVTVTGNAIDAGGSGLSQVRYGSKQEYDSDSRDNAMGSGALLDKGQFSFTVANEHKGDYYIWAYDNAGNKSKAKTIEINIDKTKPTGEIKVGEFSLWDNSIKYSQNKQLISISAADEVSGVKDIEYYVHQIDINHSNELYRRPLSENDIKTGNITWLPYKKFTMQPKDIENRFIIYARITDKAGNTTYINTDIIVLDNKAPDISVAYRVKTDKEGYKDINLAEEKYQQNTIKAEITINERNFSPKEAKLEITAVDANGELVENISPANESWKTDPQNSDKHTLVLHFTEDANYFLKLHCTDLAGNKAISYGPVEFTVDDTNPTGTIAVADSKNQKWSWANLPQITFELFSNKSLYVRIESDDATSGVASVHYLKTNIAMTKDKLNNLKESDWINGTSLCIDSDEQFIIYARIIDKSGNKTYISSNGIIMDNTSSQPKITVTAPKPVHGIYNCDVQMSIAVEEPIINGTYAGLEEIHYKVITNGVQTKEVRLLNNGKDTRQREFSQTVTIDAVINNSNDVVVEVYAKDHAGNESKVNTALKIDITAPVIEVRYDNHDALNNGYYKDTRTATIVIHERNFSEDDVEFTLTNSDGTQPVISGWSHSQEPGLSERTTHAATVSFAADGDYTFTLSYTDLAGNKAIYNTVDQFTIDKTSPEISVVYDNENSNNKYYYRAARIATIRINEHNFNPSEVNIKITATDNGSTISAPEIGSWSSNGDVRTASVTFSQDGEYIFEVEYTDMAGNNAEAYGGHFVVDTLAPEIQILEVGDMSANNSVVAPVIEYSDTNYDADSLKVTLSGYINGNMEVISTTSSIQNGERIQLNDFAYDKEYDDLYTLEVAARDKAGNQEEEKIIFSVNRFGSVYVLGDTVRGLVDNYYTNQEVSLVVTEINVDTLEFIDIAYAKDGNIEPLEEGRDYSVMASGSDVSWKSYVYTVYKDNFKEEGNYSLTFYSTDRATNVSDNKAKDMSIEFVVDKTPPTIILSGVEDAKQYNADSVAVTIDAKDNIHLQNVGLYLDNICVKTYTGDELSESNGIVTFEISNADSWQKLKITGLDAAGNEASTDEMSILVTTNAWLQFYYNKPLMAATIAATVMAAAIAGFLFFFLKRKRDNSEHS